MVNFHYVIILPGIGISDVNEVTLKQCKKGCFSFSLYPIMECHWVFGVTPFFCLVNQNADLNVTLTSSLTDTCEQYD